MENFVRLAIFSFSIRRRSKNTERLLGNEMTFRRFLTKGGKRYCCGLALAAVECFFVFQCSFFWDITSHESGTNLENRSEKESIHASYFRNKKRQNTKESSALRQPGMSSLYCAPDITICLRKISSCVSFCLGNMLPFFS